MDLGKWEVEVDAILPPISGWRWFWRWKVGGHGKWDDRKDRGVVLASRGTGADIGDQVGRELDMRMSHHRHWSGVHCKGDMVCPNASRQTVP